MALASGLGAGPRRRRPGSRRVGRPRATSPAKLGPDSTAGAACGMVSASTSVISFSEPCSMPLEQSTIGRPGARVGGEGGQRRAQVLGRRHGQDQVAVGQVGEVAGGARSAASSVTPGQEGRVLVRVR